MHHQKAGGPMRTLLEIKYPYVTFETNEKYNNVTVNFLLDGPIVDQVFT